MKSFEFVNDFLLVAAILGFAVEGWSGEYSRWVLTSHAGLLPSMIFIQAWSSCSMLGWGMLSQTVFVGAESSLHHDRWTEENEQLEWRTPGNQKLPSCCTAVAVLMEPLVEVSVCLSWWLACCFASSHMSTQMRSEEHRPKVWEEKGKVRE